MKLKTAGRRGPQNKTVRVKSNDPVTPVLSLRIQGKVAVDVEAKPERVQLGRVEVGQTVKKTVTIVARNPDGFDLTGVGPTGANVTAKVVDGNAHQVEIEVTATKAGPLNSVVTVQTNDPKVPRVPIRVFGQAVPKS